MNKEFSMEPKCRLQTTPVVDHREASRVGASCNHAQRYP